MRGAAEWVVWWGMESLFSFSPCCSTEICRPTSPKFSSTPAPSSDLECVPVTVPVISNPTSNSIHFISILIISRSPGHLAPSESQPLKHTSCGNAEVATRPPIPLTNIVKKSIDRSVLSCIPHRVQPPCRSHPSSGPGPRGLWHLAVSGHPGAMRMYSLIQLTPA